MKVAVQPDNRDESTTVGAGMDPASLWALLAILFFGAFILMFIFFNKFTGIEENTVHPVNDPIDIDSDLNTEAGL